MVLVYHGKIEPLRKEVEEIREAIDRRYVEILGEGRANQVRDVARRILSPATYFEKNEDFERKTGFGLGSKLNNKMVLLSGDLHVGADGNVLDRKVQTSVAFYIAEEAFEHSGTSRFTDRHVASYVHEFDHFVWYALQRVPVYLVKSYFQEARGDAFTEGDFSDNVRQMVDADVNPKEISKNIILYLANKNITENLEAANRILDRQVLRSIGIEVPLSWRGLPRTYETLPLPTGVIRIASGGDPFHGRSDQEAIESLLNWEQANNEILGSPYYTNLVDSIKRLKISRVGINQIVANSTGAKKKKKGRKK